MDHVDIWTDGSCNASTKQGGWGAVLEWKGLRKLLRGKQSNTTSNRMEMQAVIESLSALKRPCSITIHTDSMIVVRGCEMLRGKKSKTKANLDLWDKIWGMLPQHEWEVEWIPGHSGIVQNEIADALACYHAD